MHGNIFVNRKFFTGKKGCSEDHQGQLIREKVTLERGKDSPAFVCDIPGVTKLPDALLRRGRNDIPDIYSPDGPGTKEEFFQVHLAGR